MMLLVLFLDSELTGCRAPLTVQLDTVALVAGAIMTTMAYVLRAHAMAELRPNFEIVKQHW